MSEVEVEAGREKRQKIEQKSELLEDVKAKKSSLDETAARIALLKVDLRKATEENDQQKKTEFQLQLAVEAVQKTELERDIAELKWQLAAVEGKEPKEEVDRLKNRFLELEQELKALKIKVGEREEELKVLKAPKGINDVSVAKFDLLLQPLEKLPTLEELKTMVTRDLPTVLPVSQVVAERLYKKVNHVHVLDDRYKGRIQYVEASTTEWTQLDRILQSAFDIEVANVVKGSTEDQVHHVLDTFVQDLLRKLLSFSEVKAEFCRNATEKGRSTTTRSGEKRTSTSNESSPTPSKKKRSSGTTTAGAASSNTNATAKPSRPDFLPYIQNLLFFRGEEKRDGVSLREAEEDLVNKTLWNPAVMGRIPYVLAYTAAGSKFRLYAMHPTKSSVEVILTQIGHELDLANTGDCLELIKWMINLTPVIARANQEISTAVPPIGEEWKRASGQFCKITIHPEHLEKTLLEMDGGYVRWEGPGGLQELYALINDGKVRGTVKLVGSEKVIHESHDQPDIKLFLKPLGYRVTPLVSEIPKFLSDVLTALDSMHQNGWVHRDIKAKNIVKTVDGRWILIDLEYAAKLDSEGNADWPFFDPMDSNAYPMPARIGEEAWKPKHDVIQVGILLARLEDFFVHPQRGELIHELMNAENAAQVRQRVAEILS